MSNENQQGRPLCIHCRQMRISADASYCDACLLALSNGDCRVYPCRHERGKAESSTQQAPEPHEMCSAPFNNPGSDTSHIKAIYDASVPAAQQAEAGDAELSKGTYKCDICGSGVPHSHSDEAVEIERLVRLAFEETTVPRSAFYRPQRGATVPYSDGNTQALWQHFVSGWFDAKKHYASLLVALKSSQQEEMARTSDNVIELAGKAVRACGGEKSKTILVARILDVELEAVHAAHLAEQAKAQEAHQNELRATLKEFTDAAAQRKHWRGQNDNDDNPSPSSSKCTNVLAP